MNRLGATLKQPSEKQVPIKRKHLKYGHEKSMDNYLCSQHKLEEWRQDAKLEPVKQKNECKKKKIYSKLIISDYFFHVSNRNFNLFIIVPGLGIP